MRIALVHDFLAQQGGAERVLKALSELYPNAPIYVWFYDKERVDPYFQTKDIRTSFIQKFPLSNQRYQWYLPLLPTATDSFDLSSYDIVISSSSSFIKGVITLPKTLHVCYCHTPPRYLWTDTHEYVRNLKAPWVLKKVLPFYLNTLRVYDFLSATRVNIFISNSHNVARRIEKYYQRKSVVIYPPVDVEHAALSEIRSNYYLCGGRLMAYKRFDLIIRAFNRLKLPLKIYGDGPQAKFLKSISRTNIEFLSKITDTQKQHYLAQCIAFIHPQEEDLGITPIEAMACGKPVIAFGKGGAIETVIPQQTGVFFYEPSWESLCETIMHFKPESFNPQKIREHALQFSTTRFKTQIKSFIEEEWQKFQHSRPLA